MSTLTKAMTEDELLTAITEAATFLGWRWHHVRRSDKAQQMGHSGFPDLVLAKSGRVLFMELKSEAGKQRMDQSEWEDAIAFPVHYPGHDYFLVRPLDLNFILGVLR